MTSSGRDCTSLSVRVATIYEMVKSELLRGSENIRTNEKARRRSPQMFMFKSGLTRAGIQSTPHNLSPPQTLTLTLEKV